MSIEYNCLNYLKLSNNLEKTSEFAEYYFHSKIFQLKATLCSAIRFHCNWMGSSDTFSPGRVHRTPPHQTERSGNGLPRWHSKPTPMQSHNGQGSTWASSRYPLQNASPRKGIHALIWRRWTDLPRTLVSNGERQIPELSGVGASPWQPQVIPGCWLARRRERAPSGYTIKYLVLYSCIIYPVNTHREMTELK